MIAKLRDDVLLPERIIPMIGDMRVKISKATKSVKIQAGGIKRKQSDLEHSLSILYEKLSEGRLQIDEILYELIESKKARIRSLKVEYENLRCRAPLPIKQFGEVHTEAFCDAVREILLDTDPEITKAYLLSIVSTIEVSKREIKLKGNKVLLAVAISQWNPSISKISGAQYRH